MSGMNDWGMLLLRDDKVQEAVDQAEQDRLAQTMGHSSSSYQGGRRRLLLTRTIAALITWLLHINSVRQ